MDVLNVALNVAVSTVPKLCSSQTGRRPKVPNPPIRYGQADGRGAKLQPIPVGGESAWKRAIYSATPVRSVQCYEGAKAYNSLTCPIEVKDE